MPIYEYQCGNCGIFETTQKISDKALSSCPSCKGKVKKLISNSTFQLKGSGWYLTDYARKNGSSQDQDNKDKKDGKEAPKTDKAEKSAADSKPTKSETSKPATT